MNHIPFFGIAVDSLRSDAWLCAGKPISMVVLSIEASPVGKGIILLLIEYASKETIEKETLKNMRDIYDFGLTWSIEGFHFLFISKQEGLT